MELRAVIVQDPGQAWLWGHGIGWWLFVVRETALVALIPCAVIAGVLAWQALRRP